MMNLNLACLTDAPAGLVQRPNQVNVLAEAQLRVENAVPPGYVEHRGTANQRRGGWRLRDPGTGHTWSLRRSQVADAHGADQVG
jgi:hypothetical protein